MLEAYSSGQAIAIDGLVPFTNVALQKGETAVLAGTDSIQLNKCGVYSVSFAISGLPAANGEVSVQMSKDGVLQPQAIASVPDAFTTIGVALGMTTLVQVSRPHCSCQYSSPVVLRFVNTGVALSNASTSVIVTRLC